MLAFPVVKGDDLPLPVEMNVSIANVDAGKLIDGNAETGVVMKTARNSTVRFDLAYPKPITCRSLNISGDEGLSRIGGELAASVDGVNFTKVGAISMDGVSSFAATTGTHFRLTFPKVSATDLRLNEITMTGARIDQLTVRNGMQPKLDVPFSDATLAADEVIDPEMIINLTGKKVWSAPPGRWTIIRVGHTGTGATTHPSTSPGLECDKMSRDVVRFHLEKMYGPILADSPAQAGKALHSILLDSWECECANWTPEMPKEFAKRRGYDLTRWLPAFTGRVVKDADSTQRFFWDLRRTVADLVADNHYGVTRDFAHEHKMMLYAEAPGIGTPTVADNLECKGRTDIPMGEFWVNNTAEQNIDDPKEAASAAHIYGQNIAAAESFTSTANTAAWKNDPYALKQLGDMEFCLGINRFIFHRYAHQPWLDRLPGMSMGPWGINFERTNTWWNQGSAWIDYLARSQMLLQRGHFFADLLYFYGEGATAGFSHKNMNPIVPKGFDYDVCNAEILLGHTSVENGGIVMKSGMRYRVLVLPVTDRMTLPVLRKIEELVRDGATVYGPKPVKSPSLSGPVDGDAAIGKIAAEVWGDCDGVKTTTHTYGKGRVLWGASLADGLGTSPDFTASQPGMMFIHRIDHDSDIYFISNQMKSALTAECAFRVSGKAPELWHSDTGRTETVALYRTADGITTLPIHFDPVGSVFVVFRKDAPSDHAISLTRNGKPVGLASASGKIEIQKATFGVPGDPSKCRDATGRVKELVESGALESPVSDMTKDGDPAYGVVKTLTVDCTIDGQAKTISATETEALSLVGLASQDGDDTTLRRHDDGTFGLETTMPGDYEITLASGKKLPARVNTLPQPIMLEGSWQLAFPPKLGAPVAASFDHLMSWTDSPDDGIKYFSGTATYRKQLTVPAGFIGDGRLVILDLGMVKNLAEVSVNGKPLGVLWKEPFRVDITDLARTGANALEIRVTNLWPNRLIGDQKLPEKQRITWASVTQYKADSPLLPSGLLGPVTLRAVQRILLK